MKSVQLTMTIDLAAIGRELKKPIEQIESAVKLLDDGNTIPFITRFRKDQTGGLNEEQLLVIKQTVARLRSLAERKAFIAKSIESQEKLTEKISAAIDAASSSRELEDIYLPFKPKKQTLATAARQNGLEPLALDIFNGREPGKDLASRATDFVRVDKQLNSVDEVIAGVGHILAEKFSENVDLRIELRNIIGKTGKLTTKLIAAEPEAKEKTAEPALPATENAGGQSNEAPADTVNEAIANEATANEATANEATANEATANEATANEATAANAETNATQSTLAEPDSVVQEKDVESESTDTSSNLPAAEKQAEGSAPETGATQGVKAESADTPKKKKKKKKKKVDDPYKEFENFLHPVSKLPYHKSLAINRGEKNGRLKVRIEFDEDVFLKHANSVLVPAEHPFSEFMQSCTRDAMTRLVIPGVEREIRRETTEAAEKHAVRVFAKNLKNLLLQSPVRDSKVLAIDPGYKRGCSVALVDEGGQLIEESHIFVVGNDSRKSESKSKLVELIKKHSVQLIAIGNGTACRETEQLVSDMIATDLKGQDIKYAMVNEAGASVYSTSEVGREELPAVSPAVRSAVSIGRRLIDPLSELVKISPANIGVGLYQHDVKAKHLSESLDEVVQFCVNRVGVDVNTASPSLLKYVSGLNQLTARRVYEYRQEHGPFKNREQLKQVAGFGDATFVQSAGFLRIRGGDQPLDTSAVHPENYETANKIIERIGATAEEIFPIASCKAAAEKSSDNPDSGAETRPAEKTDSIPDLTPPAGTEKTVIEAENTPDAATEKQASESTGEAIESATVAEVSKSDSEPRAIAKPQQAQGLSLTPEQTQRRKELVQAIRDVDANRLATEFSVGQLMMRDMLNSICKPEFDPRRGVNRPVFRSGIIKIDDLKKDMCLDAQIVNVVDFGAFVDIGLGTSCLVHVSQLSSHFIRDPHRFFAVGDVLRVWVTDVDTTKRRAMLTAVRPESLQPKRREKPIAHKTFRKPGRHGHKPGQRTEKPKSRRKPKPVKQITDDMLKGAEPMRSFSDLAQFFDKQPDSNKSKGKNKK